MSLFVLNLLQVPEGEEAPPPPPPPPVVEDEEEVEPEKEVWNAYTTVKGLTISISGLKEGKRYKFRVAAKNIMGMSSFTETRQPIEIKEQMCKLSLWIIKRSLRNSLDHYPLKRQQLHNLMFIYFISGFNCCIILTQ